MSNIEEFRFVISHSPEDTAEIAKRFAGLLKKGDTVLYTGEMGAGKTHFTKGVASCFNFDDVVSSPTFALVNEYFCDMPLFHFDLFRIDSFDDLYAIGFFDYLDRDGIMLIEWSENIPALAEYLTDVYFVDIKKIDDNTREIRISQKQSD